MLQVLDTFSIFFFSFHKNEVFRVRAVQEQHGKLLFFLLLLHPSRKNAVKDSLDTVKHINLKTFSARPLVLIRGMDRRTRRQTDLTKGKRWKWTVRTKRKTDESKSNAATRRCNWKFFNANKMEAGSFFFFLVPLSPQLRRGDWAKPNCAGFGSEWETKAFVKTRDWHLRTKVLGIFLGRVTKKIHLSERRWCAKRCHGIHAVRWNSPDSRIQHILTLWLAFGAEKYPDQNLAEKWKRDVKGLRRDAATNPRWTWHNKVVRFTAVPRRGEQLVHLCGEQDPRPTFTRFLVYVQNWECRRGRRRSDTFSQRGNTLLWKSIQTHESKENTVLQHKIHKHHGTRDESGWIVVVVVVVVPGEAASNWAAF